MAERPPRTCSRLERVGVAADNIDAMFYFFKRGDEFRRYEVRATDTNTYEIVLEKPDGSSETRELPTERELNTEWETLQQDLLSSGWWGPYARDL
jgi:hypothetical protein